MCQYVTEKQTTAGSFEYQLNATHCYLLFLTDMVNYGGNVYLFVSNFTPTVNTSACWHHVSLYNVGIWSKTYLQEP